MIESHFTINSDAVTSRYDGRVPPPPSTRDEPPLGSEHSAHVDMNTRYRMLKTDSNIVRSKLSWQYGELIFVSFSFINVYASGMFK